MPKKRKKSNYESFEYYVQKVVTSQTAVTLFNTFNLPDVIPFVKEQGISSKKEKFNEYQWFPYLRVVALKPSGRIKILNFNLVDLKKN